MPTLDAILSVGMPIFGHLSFLLTFAAYAQSNIIKLRMIAVVSLTLGLAYNGWINAHMPAGDDIWLVIGWMAVFLLQNGYLCFKEIRDTLEVSLEPQSRELLVCAFPKMHSRDWQLLVANAITVHARKGDVLLNVGDPTNSLRLTIKGVATETRDGQSRPCPVGTLFGELTYVMGQHYYNASPVDIIANGDMQLYEWDYAVLDKLSTKNFRLAAALQHGFVHSAGTKHGLLWCGEKQDVARKELTH